MWFSMTRRPARASCCRVQALDVVPGGMSEVKDFIIQVHNHRLRKEQRSLWQVPWPPGLCPERHPGPGELPFLGQLSPGEPAGVSTRQGVGLPWAVWQEGERKEDRGGQGAAGSCGAGKAGPNSAASYFRTVPWGLQTRNIGGGEFGCANDPDPHLLERPSVAFGLRPPSTCAGPCKLAARATRGLWVLMGSNTCMACWQSKLNCKGSLPWLFDHENI